MSRRAVLSVIDWAHGGDRLTSHISSVPHRQTRLSESRAGGVLAKSISGSACWVWPAGANSCQEQAESQPGGWGSNILTMSVFDNSVSHLTPLSGFVCVFQALNASILKTFSAEEHLGRANSGWNSAERLPAFE